MEGGVLKRQRGGGMFQKRFKMIGCLAIIFLFSNLISAYAQYEQKEERPAPAEIIAEPRIIGEGKPYTLGKGDVLEINVQNQLEFSGQFVIGPDGKIQYSYVGDIKAEGLNKGQLKQALIKKLERFVKAPVVSVAIAEYRSKFVYILGEVGAPGKYPMSGDTTSLKEAIVGAGLPTYQAALRRIYIVKSDTEKPTYKKVDLFKILYKGITKDNVDLVSGDIVVVPSTVPSEINRALATLLDPFTRARAADLFIGHRWGAGEDYD